MVYYVLYMTEVIQAPTQDTHDFYLARLVLGSEEIVRDLIDACPHSQIVAYEGVLVLPLMPRRFLSNDPDPLGRIAEATQKLKEIPSREEVVSATPDIHKTKKSYAGSTSLRLPYITCTKKSTIQEEAASLRQTLDPPYRKGWRVFLRILETSRSSDIARASNVIDEHFSELSSRHFNVTPPRLCAVVKNKKVLLLISSGELS